MKAIRLKEIDLAKGLAIALVVWGHVVAGNHPVGDDWYRVSQEAVYLFHMPFFMFLSGVVAGYGYKPCGSVPEWREFVGDKLVRLMPAYLLIGCVVVFGKIIASKFLYVDNIPTSALSGIWDVLVQPDRSASKSLWFIYVLFLFYLTIHPLMRLVGQRDFALVLIGGLLVFVPAPEWLMLSRFCQFFVFFALGFAFGRRYDRLMVHIDRQSGVALLVFFALMCIAVLWPFPKAKILVGLLSIPALMGIVRKPLPSPVERLLLTFGKYSFGIYLFNTICIGLSKAIGLKIMPWDGANFFIFSPLLFLSGLLMPIFLKRHVFRHIPVLDRITR